MTDITEKTENGELVTNRDQLVVVDNIESLIKVIRGQQVINNGGMFKITDCDFERRTIKDLGKKWFGFSKMETLTPDELVERINRE